MQRGSTSPAMSVVPVVPSDTTNLPNGLCRALLVGVAGLATLIDDSGETRVGVPLIAGYNPLAVKRVFSSNLGAQNLWALY